jgi:putative phosphoribosyl transferase
MSASRFPDRAAAGRELGAVLAQRGYGAADPVVLGLPRGGVEVAAEVAAALGVAVDVFVARKIGHPAQPEFGVGALAEGDEEPVYDEQALRHTGLTPERLLGTVERERDELDRRVGAYRGGRELPDLAGRTVILVDDGVATGVTARAALRTLRGRGPARVVLAAPVAAPSAVDELAAEVDEVVVLTAPTGFRSVGQAYRRFGQTSDATVLRLLADRPTPSS